MVIPTGGDSDTQIALDAMCAGACVIMRGASPNDADRGLIDPALNPYFHGYCSRPELIANAKRLLSDRDGRMASSIEARKLVLSRHTLSHRITQIVNRLRIR
ncbi:MAG: glycosyltransferase [Planctomycetes bacterium]|nr:glycosyltransferase [Planctomycetota bacterium]MBI3834684.1 glycosyltransferase [Planctomycetota bacterium]